jgi:glycosyltransferase involved in cell wall biosynthesis
MRQPGPDRAADPQRAWPLDNLSVAIVCKDNAATIGRTLDSVRPLVGGAGGGGGPGEIVAVDSGSTDGTLALLESAGARVIRSAWLGHVRTKQLALEACTREWVLCLDSDESLDAELAARVWDVASGVEKSLAEGWMVRRVTHYRGEPLRHVWQPEWRLRLVKRGRARWGGFDPHDKLELLEGRAARLRPGTLRHDSFPTFAEHMRKQWLHATTMARSLHDAGVRGSYLRLLGSPTGAMLKQLVLKRGVLDGYPGWLAAASTAVAALIKHAALIELDRSGGPPGPA